MSGRRNDKGYRVGEWHGRAKYSDELVAKIRARYKPGTYGCGCRSLGKKFNLPWRTVVDIINLVTRPAP